MTHVQKKVETAKKSLAQARKANAAHAEDIAQLETELAELETRKEEYEGSLQSESLSQGRNVHLEEEQVSDFWYSLLIDWSDITMPIHNIYLNVILVILYHRHFIRSLIFFQWFYFYFYN